METLFAVTSLVLGAMVGSFLNVVIYRVPEGTFLSGGTRSHCPACGQAIAWCDNLPVLSWLVLRAKARCCGKGISVQYPLIEALTSLSFLAIWAYQDLQLYTPGTGWEFVAVGRLLLSWFFVATLLAASVIDLHHRILPNTINLIGALVGVLATMLLPEIHAGGWLYGEVVDRAGPGSSALLSAISGSAIGASLLYAVGWVGKKAYGQDAMGLGDVKFMAFTGLWLGPVGVLVALAIATLLGALIGILAAVLTGDPMIPFGPALALGCLGAWFAEDTILTFLLEWPVWMRTSPAGPHVLGGLILLCIVAILFLRRLRR